MTYIGLFEGISGFGLAFKRAGATIRAICEINPDCQKVLRRHHPEAELISDVKTINKETFSSESITVLAGGFPCQDLSVAGLRKGLDGERSGLWFEFIRIIGDHRPRWVVIENVPGLLSSNNGRDFAVILRGLVECGYGVCWRVLDTQYFGVAQRRRRVFIIASLGSGDAAEILFEREGGCWNPAPSRETGEGVTGTLSARTSAGGGLGTDFECSGGLQPFGLTGNSHYSERPATLRAEGGDCGGGSEYLIAGTVSSKWAKGTGGPSGDECQNLVVAPTLSSKANRTRVEFGQPANTLHQGGLSVLAFDWQSGGSQGRLNCDEYKTSALQASQTPAIALAQNTRDEVRYINGDGQIAGALAAEAGMKQTAYLAGQFGVRRLTPTECERLMSFPDDWTKYDDKGGVISDSARYRMLGNSVVVNTAFWIAQRIMRLEAQSVL